MLSRVTSSIRRIAAKGREDAAGWAPALERTADDIDKAPAVLPSLFATYHDLVGAISAEDYDTAESLIEDIGTIAWASSRLRVCALAPDNFPPGVFARYQKYLAVDPTTPLALVAPTPETMAAMRERIENALARLDRNVPDLAGEVREIVSEIVVAAADPAAAGDGDFSGASSFGMWGAVFLNAATHDDPVELAQAIAHEAAHLLLFAEAIDGPLVANAADERFSSPLRSDQRPMDGIYHATFVTARMHYVAEAILARGDLTDTERARLARMIEGHRRSFAIGLETVRGGAQLTDLGRSLLGDAEAYMREAANA